MSKIVCVVPTCRPERMEAFRAAWKPLFEKHGVTLVAVLDGDNPHADYELENTHAFLDWANACERLNERKGLFCRHTDACRNMGFLLAAYLKPDYILTLDDDVVPAAPMIGPKGTYGDPIQAHLDALKKRVPLTWMNTAHDTDLCFSGVPYGVRDEAPVMLSHGVWVGIPDFDGETQMRLEKETAGDYTRPDGTRVGYKLPTPHYYVGPIPQGVHFPLCGMNVMIRRESLPYFYFAPMGPDSGFPNLHRFADIFIGIAITREFATRGWASYTGASTVLHMRASDAKENFEKEKVGRAWIEDLFSDKDQTTPDADRYFTEYMKKRERYARLIEDILK